MFDNNFLEVFFGFGLKKRNGTVFELFVNNFEKSVFLIFKTEKKNVFKIVNKQGQLIF